LGASWQSGQLSLCSTGCPGARIAGEKTIGQRERFKRPNALNASNDQFSVGPSRFSSSNQFVTTIES
jgi:hypothetical protein